jgi:hypothetical protein
MKPIVGAWGGGDSLLVFAWMIVAQLLPSVSWMGNILDGAPLSDRIFCFEVERAKVDRVISLAIHPVKNHSYEALLLYVPAANVYFDCAITELNSREVRESIAAQPHSVFSSVLETSQATVKNGQDFPVGQGGKIGLNTFLLANYFGSKRKSGERDERQINKITSIHSFPFSRSAMALGRRRSPPGAV